MKMLRAINQVQVSIRQETVQGTVLTETMNPLQEFMSSKNRTHSMETHTFDTMNFPLVTNWPPCCPLPLWFPSHPRAPVSRLYVVVTTVSWTSPVTSAREIMEQDQIIKIRLMITQR